jgi:pimeloyl-ACP methyl ester carboxylesterase
MAHRFHLVESFDVADRGGQVTVPTLALAGNRDLLVSPKGLRTLVRSLPDARAVRLEGCGHLAFVTHPEQVAEQVRMFLGR